MKIYPALHKGICLSVCLILYCLQFQQVCCCGQEKGHTPEETVSIASSNSLGPLASATADVFKPGVEVVLWQRSTADKLQAFIDGNVDVLFMRSYLNLDQVRQLADVGVVPVQHVIARVPLSFYVHIDNPVRNLSEKQLNGILIGRITNWKTVGGEDSEIMVCHRHSQGGTFATLERLFPKIKTRDNRTEFFSFLEEDVVAFPHAMSYCLASSEFVHDLHRSQEGEQRLRCLRIDGALPDIAGVQSGEYELSIPIVLITRNSPAVGSALFNMIGFYHSERGEKLLHALCLVPLTQYNLCE